MLPQDTDAVFTEPVLSSSSVADVMTRKRRTYRVRRLRNAGHLSYRVIGSFLPRIISGGVVNMAGFLYGEHGEHDHNFLSASVALEISRTVTSTTMTFFYARCTPPSFQHRRIIHPAA